MTPDATHRLEVELLRSLAALTASEYERLLRATPEAEIRELLRHAGSIVPPKFMRCGVGHHLARRVTTLPVGEQVHLAKLLARSALADVYGPEHDGGSLPELTELTELLRQADTAVEWSPALARVLVVLVATQDADRRQAALELLDEQPRLQLGGFSDSPHDPDRKGRERVRRLHTVANHGLGPNHALSEQWTEAEVADESAWEGPTSLGDVGDELFEEDGLFSGLDLVLLKTAVAVHAAVVGAPTKGEFRQIVDEFVHLSASRPSSYFLLGFATAFDELMEEPPESELDAERRRWHRFGRVAGLIRAADRETLVAECIEHRRQVAELVGDSLKGARIVGGVVRALMREHAPVAAEILRARQHPFDGCLELYRDVYSWARVLVVTERAAEAEALFAALNELPLQDPDRWTEQQRRADLVRRRVTCKRSLVDFASAQLMLDTVDVDGLDDRSLGALHAERGLVAARAKHLRHIVFPEDEPEREATAERLHAAQKHFEVSLQHNPDDVRACYCLGVLSVTEADYHRAAALLERTEAGLIRDPVLSRTGMLERTRFHRAAATLQTLEPGTDSAAVDALVRSLNEGYRPPMRTVIEVVEALVTHQSPHTARFLRHVVTAVRDLQPLVHLVADLITEGRGDLRDLVRQFVDDPRASFESRFRLLEASLTMAGREGELERQFELIEAIDDLLVRACDPDLDGRWEAMLAADEHLRAALEPAEADMLRIGVLQRLGRLDDVRSAATMLFYRAAHGGLERYDPEDLLELIERMGADDDELARLRRAIPHEGAAATTDAATRQLDRPLRVIFAGGNETQARYQQEIEERLAERYGPGLELIWFNPGWSMNWIKDAERIEAALPTADAMVILTFMRTNLGRHLRRAAGLHDVLWRSCTGQGKASMERALVSAVEGVLEGRRPSA